MSAKKIKPGVSPQEPAPVKAVEAPKKYKALPPPKTEEERLARKARSLANIKGRAWKKGQSGNPAGKPKGTHDYTKMFRKALDEFRTRKGFNLFEHFLATAKANPMVLISAMNKIIPNKTQVSFGDEELDEVKDRFVAIICRHVTDPDQLKAIADEIEQTFAPEDEAG